MTMTMMMTMTMTMMMMINLAVSCDMLAAVGAIKELPVEKLDRDHREYELEKSLSEKKHLTGD